MAITLVIKNQVKSKKPTFSDVRGALAELEDKYGSWDYKKFPRLHLSIMAGVFLSDDPSESPHEHFDFSNLTNPEHMFEALREAPLLQSFASKRLINMQRRLIEKFPKVKHA